MPTVEKSAHLGILRSKSNQKTENSQIEQNITKARRIAYSLLSTGFYGKNGLLENREPALTLSSFDVELTGHKLFFYCVIMLSTYVVKQSHIFDI
jgi:hypothetical protein